MPHRLTRLMDGQTNELMVGRLDRWSDGLSDGRSDERTDGQIDGLMGRRTNEWMTGWTARLTVGRIN